MCGLIVPSGQQRSRLLRTLATPVQRSILLGDEDRLVRLLISLEDLLGVWIHHHPRLQHQPATLGVPLLLGFVFILPIGLPREALKGSRGMILELLDALSKLSGLLTAKHVD